MKIGIISDTHGSEKAWRDAVERYFEGADMILHSGDVLYHGPRNPLPEGYNPMGLAEMINSSKIPVIFAQGNCDADIDQMVVNWPIQSPYAFVQAEGLRIMVHHGHLLTPEELPKLAERYKLDLYISGHTHLPVLERRGGTLYLNPGSSSLPKTGDKEPTAAILEGRKVRIFRLSDGSVVDEAKI